VISTSAVPGRTRTAGDVRAALALFPATLAVHDFCLAVFRDNGWAAGIEGSCAAGRVDEFSDLDFVVVCPPSTDIDQALTRVAAALSDGCRPIALFRADHVGQPGMLVAYLVEGEWAVKADVRMIGTDRLVARPPFVTLHDPAGVIELAGPAAPGLSRGELDTMREKACGWLWYSYAKAMRGELFQAARSLDFTRENALLPCLLDTLGLPQDGHRHIEDRLPAEIVDRLALSHPRELTRPELLRALDCLAEHLVEVFAAVPPPAVRAGALAQMVAIIRAGRRTP
jgi:hypothetical protein